MATLIQIALLSFLASLLVLAVRFLVMPGIDKSSKVLGLGSKARGKLLGYVTSAPEWVIVVSSAFMGVYDAGFWNIASSNIINWLLFLAAVSVFRQTLDLKRKATVDEIAFGIFSVALPLALYKFEIRSSALLAVCLLLVFVGYKIADYRLNPKVSASKESNGAKPNLLAAIASIVAGMLVILVAGFYIGSVAENLIRELGVPSWMIGWILGLISSIPEMSGFFEIFRKYKQAGTLKGIDDTQEALDALVASNMCNLCLILPFGILIVALF